MVPIDAVECEARGGNEVTIGGGGMRGEGRGRGDGRGRKGVLLKGHGERAEGEGKEAWRLAMAI